MNDIPGLLDPLGVACGAPCPHSGCQTRGALFAACLPPTVAHNCQSKASVLPTVAPMASSQSRVLGKAQVQHLRGLGFGCSAARVWSPKSLWPRKWVRWCSYWCITATKGFMSVIMSDSCKHTDLPMTSTCITHCTPKQESHTQAPPTQPVPPNTPPAPCRPGKPTVCRENVSWFQNTGSQKPETFVPCLGSAAMSSRLIHSHH